MFQCCFHLSTNESECVFPLWFVLIICFWTNQGNMGRPGPPGPTGPPGQGLQGPKVSHWHTQIIKNLICIYVFWNLTAGLMHNCRVIRAHRVWAGQEDLLERECLGQRSQVLLYNLRCDWMFIQFINMKPICVFQGDRGAQGERGVKGVKGDMGDPGIPGQAVSKLTSTLPELLSVWSILNQL